MNFHELEINIEEATKKAFKELFTKYSHEEIYCFSLYSDEGAMTVCPSMNTIDFLNKLNDEEKEELAYYKFEPAEWKYEMVGAIEEFNEISTKLRTELEKNNFENEYKNEKTFLEFRNRLFEICINVLKRLKNEDFFRKITGQDVFLVFSVSDFEFDLKGIESMVIKLNDNDYKSEYLNWMKTWVE